MGVIAEAALNGELDTGTRADRFQVVVHVDASVLEDDAPGGQSVIEGGVGVSAETSRRIACDASVVTMTHDAAGNVLDVGRKTRTVPTALRRALDARDPTCVWPGCDCRFVQAHHIVFWANGGETKLDNLVNLCSYHHHRLHDDGYRVELDALGRAHLFQPNGSEIAEVPGAPTLPNRPLAELKLEGWEGRPKWGYEPVNTEDVIQTYWRPREPGGEPEFWSPGEYGAR